MIKCIKKNMMKKFVALAFTLAAVGCAPKPVLFDVSNAPDTPVCEIMKETCKDAYAFQSRYESMSREEKEDAKAIMNAYIDKCQAEQEMCRRSAVE